MSAKSASLIDHIYTNPHLIFISGILNINTSDHYPCFVIRKKSKSICITTTYNCRKLKYLDHAFFRNRLEELDWRSYYEITDQNLAWTKLYSMLLETINNYYPVVTVKNVPVRAAWLNSDLFECMVRCDDAFDTAKSTNCPKDREKAKKLRNKVVDMCNSAKNENTKTNFA